MKTTELIFIGFAIAYLANRRDKLMQGTAQPTPGFNLEYPEVSTPEPQPTPTPAPVPTPTPIPPQPNEPPPATPTGLQAVYHPILPEQPLVLPMQRGQMYILPFVSGPDGSRWGVGFGEFGGSTPFRALTVSQTPGDFDYARRGAVTGGGKSGEMSFTVSANPIGGRGAPQTILPNTQYYINFRNENPAIDPGGDTCQPGENCSFIITLTQK